MSEHNEPTQHKLTCPECGAVNSPDAAECSVCGTGLVERGTVTAAATAQTASAPAAKRSTDVRDYLIFFLGAIVIALVVFIVATPEEHAGPPQPAQPEAQTGLPPDHPHVSQEKPVITPEAQQQLDALQAKVDAGDAPPDSILRLANLLYDYQLHAEALPYYRKYVDLRPDDADARADMAYSIASSGDLDGAIAELRGVLATHPQHQFAAYNLAVMFLDKGAIDSTVAYLRKVVQIDPTSKVGASAQSILQSYKEGHPVN